jgi:hypothetical protein
MLNFLAVMNLEVDLETLSQGLWVLPPSKSENCKTLKACWIDTPLGPMLAVASAQNDIYNNVVQYP